MTGMEQYNAFKKMGKKEKKMLKTIEVDQKQCRRCLGSWIAKVENPKCCALCHSPYWDKDRLKTGDVGARNKYGFDQWEIGKWYPIPSFVKADGWPDTGKNETRWRSLAQFARRRGLNAHFEHNRGPLSARAMLVK